MPDGRQIHVWLAFGFLASQEVKDAGEANLGLHDRACPDSLHDQC